MQGAMGTVPSYGTRFCGGTMFKIVKGMARSGKANEVMQALVLAAGEPDGAGAVEALLRSGRWTDDEQWWGLSGMFGIASQVPEVRAQLEYMTEQLPQELQPALRSAMRVIDTGNTKIFQGHSASSQLALHFVLAKIIGHVPEARAYVPNIGRR